MHRRDLTKGLLLGAAGSALTVRDAAAQTTCPPPVCVEQFGAVGDGSTDDTAAIQAAISSLPSANVYPELHFTAGRRYRITDNGTYGIIFDRPMIVQGHGAILEYSGSQRAVRVNANNVIIHALIVRKPGYSTGGAVSALSGTGVNFLNCFDFRTYDCQAEGFQYGVTHVGSGAGCSLGEHYAMLAFNNQYNMHFQADATAGSYCTQIKVFGGKAQVLSAFAGGHAGSRGVSIVKASNAVDGIDFYGTLVEGYAARKIYCEASWCSFISCYPDVRGPPTGSPIGPDFEFTGTSSNNFVCAGSGLDVQSISDSGSNNVFLIPKTFPVRQGLGSPEGVVTAHVGTMYLRTDGSTGSTLYVKEAGTGPTGWAAK